MLIQQAERELNAMLFLVNSNPRRYKMEEQKFPSGLTMIVLKDLKLNEYISDKIVKNSENKITKIISHQGWIQ